jgi:hypothetical protein
MLIDRFHYIPCEKLRLKLKGEGKEGGEKREKPTTPT